MTKSLKKVLKDNPSIDYLKNKGEKAFAAKHKVEVVADANGNGDDVFKGGAVSPRPRGSVSPESSPKDSYGPGKGPMVAGVLVKDVSEGAGVISAKGSASAKVKVGKAATAKVVTGGGQQPGKTDKYVKEAVMNKAVFNRKVDDVLSNVKRTKNGFSGVLSGSPSDKKFLERWGAGKAHPTGVKHAKTNPMAPKKKHTTEETDLTEQEYFKLSIPLLIRLMEYAKEDAKTDMDLHFVAERVVEFGDKDLCMDDYAKLVKEATESKIEESVTRKHFKNVANTVRAIEDPAERQKFADHHAAIFAGMNPRFDNARFHAAAGTQYVKPTGRKTVKEEAIDENLAKTIGTIKKIVKRGTKVVKKVVKGEVDNWKRTDS